MRLLFFFRLRLVSAALVSLIVGAASASQYLVEKPARAKAQHAMVFLGTVETVKDTPADERSYRRRLARVRMSSIWKGIPNRGGTLVTETVDPWGPPLLVPGETYVFYVDSTAAGWGFAPGSRTRRLVDADEDLEALGKPVIVQRLPGRKSHP